MIPTFFLVLAVIFVVVLLLCVTFIVKGRLPIRKVRKTVHQTEEPEPVMSEAEQFDYLDTPAESEDHSRKLPRITHRDITDAKESEWRGSSGSGHTDASPMYLPQNDGEWSVKIKDDPPDEDDKLYFGDR
jgi:hypothetical protein